MTTNDRYGAVTVVAANEQGSHAALSFSLCDPDAVLTREQRQARDEALRRLAEARRRGPTTQERVQ